MGNHFKTKPLTDSEHERLAATLWDAGKTLGQLRCDILGQLGRKTKKPARMLRQACDALRDLRSVLEDEFLSDRPDVDTKDAPYFGRTAAEPPKPRHRG